MGCWRTCEVGPKISISDLSLGQRVSISEARIPRRLAAIIAADVAGYSRLMGVDEDGTFRRLSERREVMDSLIEQYGGRIANAAGDSVIAEFPSVVAALECAIGVQRAHAQLNAALASNQRVAFRIGVHLGDVLVKDGDLFGDGVNIAARLEQLAEPGGIAISARVKEEITGKLSVRAENLGLHDLKNIVKPVGVWRVLWEPEAVQRGSLAARLHRLKSKILRHGRVFMRRRRAPAIALAAALGAAAGTAYFIRTQIADALVTYEVKPFAVVAESENAKPLANMLTMRLTDGLGTIPNVRLLPADSQTAPASSRNAKYSISGSLSPGLSSTRVDARIVDTATGQVIAASNFVAPSRPLDEMQDEILGAIGDDLSVEINKLRYDDGVQTPDRQRALRLAEEARTRVDLRTEPTRAIGLYDEATRLWPNNLDIAGWYANALVAMASFQTLSSGSREAYLTKAKAVLEAKKSEVPFHRLLIYAECQLDNYDGHPEAALAACDQTLKLSPWSARAHKEIGTAYMQMGQLERSLAEFDHAERLDRRHAVRTTWEIKAGIACLLMDRDQCAADWFDRAATVSTRNPWVFGLSAVAHHRLGNLPATKSAITALRSLPKEDSTKEAVRNVLQFYQFTDQSLNAKLSSIVQEFEGLFDAN
jgi:class 3 adenylate cyclase